MSRKSQSHRSIKQASLISILLVVGLIVVILVFQGGVSNAQQNQQASDMVSSQYPPGVQAITPTSPGTTGNTPGFTVNDVKAYLAASGAPATAPGGHYTVEKIVFISAKEASTLMRGESTGRPDNALVCYVLLKGPFTIDISLPPPPQGKTWGKPVYPKESEIEEVFDAHTGNLLVWGIPASR